MAEREAYNRIDDAVDLGRSDSQVGYRRIKIKVDKLFGETPVIMA